MFEATSVFWFVAAVLAAFSAVASIFFGNFLLPEKEGEETEILKNFQTSSRAEINRIVHPKPFYGYDPVARRKTHRAVHAI